MYFSNESGQKEENHQNNKSLYTRLVLISMIFEFFIVGVIRLLDIFKTYKKKKCNIWTLDFNINTLKFLNGKIHANFFLTRFFFYNSYKNWLNNLKLFILILGWIWWCFIRRKFKNIKIFFTLYLYFELRAHLQEYIDCIVIFIFLIFLLVKHHQIQPNISINNVSLQTHTAFT